MTPERIRRSIRRMAFEVVEQNGDVPGVVLAAVCGQGEIVARKLAGEIASISSLPLRQVRIEMDKASPVGARVDLSDMAGWTVVVVDDVSNTGRTLLYALAPFLALRPVRLQSLVLVERSHRLFPVQPDYRGLSVSTTLQEHIAVEAEGEEISGAWLY